MTTFDEAMVRMVDARIAAAQRKLRDHGTVVQRDTTGPGALVTFDGSTAPTPVKVLGHVHCFEGDRVVLDLYKDRWVITGTFARRELGEFNTRTYGPLGSGTTTSATFVDMPSDTSITEFTKRYDATSVQLRLVATFWATAAVVAETAVRISGTPGTDTALTFTPIEHIMAYEQLQNTPIRSTLHGQTRQVFGAGSYTLTARWRRVSGAGTMSMNETDLITLEADERFRTESN